MYEVVLYLKDGGREYEFLDTLTAAREYVRNSHSRWCKASIIYPEN